MRFFSYVLGLAAISAVLPANAHAQRRDAAQDSPLITRMSQCRAIAEPAARLSCFDAASSELLAAVDRGEVSVVNRAEVRQVRRSLFGFGLPKLPFFRGDRSADEQSDTLETTIKSAQSIGNGKYRILVSEGDALWETTETYGSLSEPEPGQKIVLKRGPMGSYMIRINGQRGVRGKRIS